MYRVEFGVVHEGCVVNELSRAVPSVRLVCPGGFIVSAESADEILALSHPTDAEVEAVLEFLSASPAIAESGLVERTPDHAYVHLLSQLAPAAGYCSQVVEKNRCFRLGYEIQANGVEQWQVGCAERSQAEGLLRDLPALGELKYGRITEASWADLIAFSTT
jgi:hypothetical protein